MKQALPLFVFSLNRPTYQGGTMGRFQWTDILILVVLAVLLFGAKRLPELARAVGKSITEFKRGMNNLANDIKDDKDNDKKA